MNNINLLWIAAETIIYFIFIFVCTSLAKSRFTFKKTAVILIAGTLLTASLNMALFLGSHDLAFTLEMLPLTAYIPAIIVLHILSDSSFFKTIYIWCIGFLGMYAGYFSLKLSLTVFQPSICLLSLLTVTFIICFVTAVYIRKPFHEYIPRFGINYSLLIAAALLITLPIFSYFSNSATNLTFILFLVAIVILFMIAKFFGIEYSKLQLNKIHEKYKNLIEAQQNEFQEITFKNEQLREYRHDMRHHLTALGNILRDSESFHAMEYFNTLVQRLEHTENVSYCKNQTINAVLSFHISKAKEIGCVLDTHISIPEKIDIEDVDFCIILSNALENAVNACAKEDAEHRFIKIKVVYKNVLTISIINSCTTMVSFDKKGLPKNMTQSEHGIGMKSITNTVEKYGGTVKCECADGEFKLNILMFHASKNDHKPFAINSHKTHVIHIGWQAFALIFSIIGIFVFLNAFSTVAEAPTDIPAADLHAQVITDKRHRFGWGANEFDVEEPGVILLPSTSYTPQPLSKNAETETAQSAAFASAEPTADTSAEETSTIYADTALITSGVTTANPTSAPESYTVNIPKISESTTSAPETIEVDIPKPSETVTENPALEDSVEEINYKMSDYIDTLRQTYYWYLNRRYMGYTSLESTYDVLRNDKDILSIKIEGTLNVGGSANFNRCFTLDKRTCSVVELEDLFLKDADYITPISNEILDQMTARVASGNGMYFIPGGIWRDDECFKSIAKDQNFYINDQNKLVIAFDEYEVAPGSMGCVEFVIPTDVIDPILTKPSLIQ